MNDETVDQIIAQAQAAAKRKPAEEVAEACVRFAENHECSVVVLVEQDMGDRYHLAYQADLRSKTKGEHSARIDVLARLLNMVLENEITPVDIAVLLAAVEVRKEMKK